MMCRNTYIEGEKATEREKKELDRVMSTQTDRQKGINAEIESDKQTLKEREREREREGE
jgi:hypothetical protein